VIKGKGFVLKQLKKQMDSEDRLYVATQWQLMMRKFAKHKLAIAGSLILVLFYMLGIFCEFFAVQNVAKRNTDYIYVPPQKIHWFATGVKPSWPFVYGLKKDIDPVTWRKTYVEDRTQKYPLRLFVKGDSYRMWGLIPGDIHFIGVARGQLFLMGTDDSGRDLFSRIMYALRVSLTIGLLGVLFTFVLGCIFGGVSGYYGGTVDLIIQRIIEFLMSMPSIPLWMALSASFPKNWSPQMIYVAITVILSLIGWSGLARVIRGKLLEMREEDFVLAAKLAGAKDSYLICKHLLPGFMSYLIVNITLSVPGMILGETSLSFLGIGLRSPIVSLGVLLKDAQNINTIAINPWLLIPGIFIFITILAFNFLGDGLRDAADPYK
jgi:peptide/nickel transport system permease protein